MPQTAFLVLGGCLAISALPPLNGFVSEWLIFQAILLSPDLPQWGLKLMVPAVGAMLALGAALSAACFVRAYGIAFLGRPRIAGRRSGARDRHASRARPWVSLLALCLLVGLLPGLVIDALAPVAQRLVGQAMPPQTGIAWLSIVPVAESRSSYNGLLVFVFITVSTLLAIEIIHRFASRAVRRGPAWDCGFPDPSPATQYTADSFAQPIRRVFGPVVFQARERVDMPPPGDARPARLTVTLRDLVWDTIYAPIGGAVSGRGREAQPPAVPDHPPIPEPGVRRPRRAAAGGVDMDLIRDLAVQGAADGAGARAGAAAAGLHAQGQGAPAAPARAAAAAALPRSPAPHPQGGGAGRQRLLAVPQRPLHDLRRHLGGGRAGADVRHRAACSAGPPT